MKRNEHRTARPMGLRAPRLRSAAALVLWAGVLPCAWAQELGDDVADVAEGSRLVTTVETGATYTDNFFSQRSPEREALGAVLKGGLAYSFGLPRFSFRSELSGEGATFDIPDDVDDYVDGELGLGVNWRPAQRHRLGWGARLVYDHDAFGTERTENTPLQFRELDRWRRQVFDVRYLYSGGAFSVLLRLGTNDKKYTSNREATRFLDFETAGGSAALFYAYSPKTSAYVSVEGRTIAFEDTRPNFPSLDANEIRYHVGARWKATAKTTGDVRVGWLNREADDPERGDFDAVDWQATVGWTPRRNQLFSLRTAQATLETYLAGSDRSSEFIRIQAHELSWTQHWTASFNTQLSGSFTAVDFVGIAREDEVFRANAGAEYHATRYLFVLGNVNIQNRDSSVASRDFDKLNGYLGVRYVR